MTEPRSPPDVWSKASVAWSDPHFGSQIQGCTSIDHLRMAANEEATSKTRTERIAMINKRIETVKQVHE